MKKDKKKEDNTTSGISYSSSLTNGSTKDEQTHYTENDVLLPEKMYQGGGRELNFRIVKPNTLFL